TRLEESVADLEFIAKMESVSREGQGEMFVEARRGVDMNSFVDEVKLRVDAINNLPPTSYRPIVRRMRAEQIYMGIVVHGDIDLLTLKRLADDVRDEIAELPGAARAQVWATLPEEVAIEVSEEALRRYGLTFDEVAAAVRMTSVNTSSGSVRTEVGDVQLRARNLADTAADFEDIVLRQTPEGAIIRVGDVATVVDRFDDANRRARFNNEPSAIVTVPTIETGMNVVETQQRIVEYLDAKRAELPAGVSLSLWWDDSKYYFERIKTIASSAALGLTLVLIVLVLFLRPIVAFWVTIGIAVAFAGAFALLPPLGVSLNMLSLFAFLLVIGIVVDDAIIVGEKIHNQVERGLTGHDAAIHGARLVSKPVIFAVITTVMAFAPWMLLTGPEVQFTRQLSLVVIAALALSLIESLLILPNHLSHLRPQRFDGRMGGYLRFQRRIADMLVTVARRVYRPLIEPAIRHRYVTMALFASLAVLTLTCVQTGFVQVRFAPDVEAEFLEVDITFPEGTPFTRVIEVSDRLEAAEKRLMDKANAEHGGAGEVQIVESISSIATDARAQAWVGLAPPETRPKGLTARDVAESLRAELGPIPDAEEVKVEHRLVGQEGGVRFAVRSRDVEALRAAADELMARLATYDAVLDVRDDLSTATDEARFRLKPGAESLGLSYGEVSRQVGQAYYGEEAQRLPRNGEDVRVMVRLTETERRSLDSLADARVRTQDGREVPLTAIADIDYAPGETQIRRRDRLRAVTVIADVRGDEVGEIHEDLEKNFFPDWEARHPLVKREATGDAEAEREFLQEFLVLLAIMLASMYALLAIAFRAVFQPILVMTALPFSAIGAVYGHMIFGLPLSLYSIFGIIAAGGVVVNDNLVLLDYVNRLRERGAGAFQALVEAGVARFRPILLTSVTTFVGVLPMMAERSTQAEFLKPMVVGLGFAVLFALTLSLVLVPALYAIGIDIGRFLRWAAFGGEYSRIGHAYDRRATYGGDMGVVAIGDADEPRVIPSGSPRPAG
ncbi:MAG: efflux RND transporter permease subunit, partial [Caulobacterales bacterium]|nr:efflux RND transporter permease subunit [Caulobacterales bacterium]